MGHHDQTSPTQGQPRDKAAQQGSGDMTGAPDQGGSGQTSEPRMNRQSQDTGYAGAPQGGGAAGSTDQQSPEDAALDPRGSKPTPR